MMLTTTGELGEFTPSSMKSRTFRGKTERRHLVAGRWQRVPQQQAMMQVFGRDAAIAVSEASILRYHEASTLRSLLA